MTRRRPAPPVGLARSLSRRTTRRQFLLGGTAAVAAVGVGHAFGVEPRWLEERTISVALPRLAGPVRVLHLSDLHRSGAVGLGFLERAIRRGLARDPGLVCLTGDFVTAGSATSLAGYAEILALLSGQAPTYAVLGNHDGGDWSRGAGGEATLDKVTRLLGDAGIEVLHNRSVVVGVGGGLRLVGLADLWSGQCDPAAAFAGVAADAPMPTVLLAHNPDSKDRVAGQPWDLMLSGHTHGGQVVVPLLGPPFATVRDRRYLAGLNPWRDRWIYTTRGVGNLFGVRFNCRPEISVLELAA